MELVFDDRGLLLPGVYDVSMDVVKEHFGQFQRTDRRPTLFAKLVDYLDALNRAGIDGSVIVDGSFVMAGIDGQTISTLCSYCRPIGTRKLICYRTSTILFPSES